MDYVTICNLALFKIGNFTAVTSITENTKPAILFNTMYEAQRDMVLRSHFWPFATKKVQLAPIVTEPAWGGGNYFEKPADCLRIIGTEDPYIEWAEENNLILCPDTDTFNLLYVSQVTDPNQFDSLFVEAYSSKMASIMAMPLTGSVDTAGNMLKLYDRDLQLARTISSTQNSGRYYVSDLFIRSRASGTVP